MASQQAYQSPAYRLADISIPQDTSRLSIIASTFALRERAKDARMYDESGCWFVCGCDQECGCDKTCDCFANRGDICMYHHDCATNECDCDNLRTKWPGRAG